MANINMIRENARAYKAKRQSEANEWAELCNDLAKSLAESNESITGDVLVDDIVMYLLEDTPVHTKDDNVLTDNELEEILMAPLVREDPVELSDEELDAVLGVDDFLADVDECKKEAEALETKELLVKATISDNNKTILDDLLASEDMAEFANKAITKEEQ